MGLKMQAIKRSFVMGFFVGALGAQAEYIPIGDPGNALDNNSGYGAVAHEYAISDTEVTIAQFLLSPADSGNEDYWNDDFFENSVGLDAPATYVSLFEAMKYCNWLTSGSTTNGAYLFDGAGSYLSTDRAAALSTYGIVYALPTENEWYKAAYYKNGTYSAFAHGQGLSDSPPVVEVDANYGGTGGTWDSPWPVKNGTVEQNGTWDMGGNVNEWMEEETGVVRGGSYFDLNQYAMANFSRTTVNPSSSIGTRTLGFRTVRIGSALTNGPLPVLQIAQDGTVLDFWWNSEAGKFYDLESTDSLTNQQWAVHSDGIHTYTNIAASGTGTTAQSGVLAVHTRRFFKVRLRD